jgi:hypothetical protein
MPLMSRAGQRGDDLGSRVLAGRLVGTAVHLAFLLSRTWPPYPKWAGTAFAGLSAADDLGVPLGAVLRADDWRARERGLEQALAVLAGRQRSAGLPVPPGPPCTPFFDRPFLGVRPEMAAVLVESLTDPAVRELPVGVGAIEQWVDNVHVLTRPARRTAVTRTLAAGSV